MTTATQWVAGARPRTLPAALAPVAVGTGAAAGMGAASASRATLALVVALALQVGVNYANDYSDGIRGTDDVRVGPFRLTASGAAPPGSVRAAAVAAFAVAGVTGVILLAVSGAWALLPAGIAAVVSAWFYTGGPHPYGYAGLGEVFVFTFFGLLAVLGTAYTQAGRLSAAAVAGAAGVGFLACALLVTNNLRDIPTDAAAGKRTLAVRLGDRRTRALYSALLTASGLAVVVAATTGTPVVLVTLVAGLLAVRPVRTVLGGAAGRDLIPVLRDTGRLELVYGLLFAAALASG